MTGMNTLPLVTHATLKITACMLLATLAACSKAITVKGDFPEPLVEPLPLTVGLQYSKDLANYQYSEALPDDATWSFDLGEANIALFDSVFGALFQRTRPIQELQDLAAIEDSVDAVIAPSVEAFEFSLPRQARSDQFSVWIRYNLDVYGPDGELITRWPISAYGQSDSQTFGADDSMALATIRAMRDAAATIVMRFATQPKIKESLLKELSDEET